MLETFIVKNRQKMCEKSQNFGIRNIWVRIIEIGKIGHKITLFNGKFDQITSNPLDKRGNETTTKP